MTRRRLALYLTAAPAGFLLTALALYAWHGLAPRAPDPVPVAAVDRPLPEFSLPGLGGGAPGLAAADFDGAVTVLNLFASWCVPCLAEHPVMTRLAGEGTVRVVGIAWMDDPEAAAAWLAEHGNPYALVGADRTGALRDALEVRGVPTTYIVDADGTVRFRREGPLVSDRAVAEFRDALDAVRR